MREVTNQERKVNMKDKLFVCSGCKRKLRKKAYSKYCVECKICPQCLTKYYKGV